MGVPEIEAKTYAGKLRGSNVLVAVHTDEGAVGLGSVFSNDQLVRAAALRADGWHTVAALVDGEDGAAQRCSHWLDGREPRAY